MANTTAATEADFISAIQRLQDLELNDSPSENAGDDFEMVPPGQQIQMRGDQVCAFFAFEICKTSVFQVQNNASGYVFQVTDETRIRRFLILGTTGGTYYVSEEALTSETIAELERIIRSGNGDMILREIAYVLSF